MKESPARCSRSLELFQTARRVIDRVEVDESSLRFEVCRGAQNESILVVEPKTYSDGNA